MSVEDTGPNEVTITLSNGEKIEIKGVDYAWDYHGCNVEKQLEELIKTVEIKIKKQILNDIRFLASLNTDIQ